MMPFPHVLRSSLPAHHGTAIVDAGHCGAKDDLTCFTGPLVDLSPPALKRLSTQAADLRVIPHA